METKKSYRENKTNPIDKQGKFLYLMFTHFMFIVFFILESFINFMKETLGRAVLDSELLPEKFGLTYSLIH